MRKIELDRERFNRIVEGKIRKDLRKFVEEGYFIGEKGKQRVKIPIHTLDTPQFEYDQKQLGGIGQGPGDRGTTIGKPGYTPGSGAGSAPGEHIREVEVETSVLVKILEEELHLQLKPKKSSIVTVPYPKYNRLRKVGPEGLRRFKQTYLNALKRQIAEGTYNPDKPMIIPIHEDKRYRTTKEKPVPESNGVMIYMMDISGSMGYEQKQIVRLETGTISMWVGSKYTNFKEVFIVHDVRAQEVGRDTFFSISESGGTKISSAYLLAADIIDKRFPPDEWNIYAFHFSDGDNWGSDDTRLALDTLDTRIIPASNIFGYGQVKSMHGSGLFIKDVRERFRNRKDVNVVQIDTRHEVFDAIKILLRPAA